MLLSCIHFVLYLTLSCCPVWFHCTESPSCTYYKCQTWKTTGCGVWRIGICFILFCACFASYIVFLSVAHDGLLVSRAVYVFGFCFQVLCASNEGSTIVEPLLPPEGAKIGERVSFAGYDICNHLDQAVRHIYLHDLFNPVYKAFKMNITISSTC